MDHYVNLQHVIRRREAVASLAAIASAGIGGCNALGKRPESREHLVRVQNRTNAVENVGVVVENYAGEELFNRSYRIEGESIRETDHFEGTPHQILVRRGERRQRAFEYDPTVSCSKEETVSVEVLLGQGVVDLTYGCG